MATNMIHVPWGGKKLPITLPASWHVNGILEPNTLPGSANPEEEIRAALQCPNGTARLSELIRPEMQIVLVIDDGSRPTPVAKILPLVIEEIERCGGSAEQITILPALGVHRPMTDEEVAERVGKPLAARLKWESHDCDDPARLANLGTTSRGTPVLINKTAAEADFIISVGCIEPHIIASFGGGYKNLVPGIAGRATIAHNHALNCHPDTFNMVGQPIEQNPMRMDLEEAAGMLKPPVFIINAVLNSSLEVVKVVCGHPIAAHREGARVSASIYGAKIPALADVVITASHPMDQDLRQGVKALANTIRAVRPGGVLITLVRADEGTGVFGLANRKLPVGKRALKILAPLLLPRVGGLKLKGMGEEDKFFLYFALKAMTSCRLLMYAPTIPAEIQERLPFIDFADHVERIINMAQAKAPKQAEVLVFPHGGMTYPILPGQS